MNNLKDRIRKIRRDLDLTQQEFADRLGVKRGAIANYEIGRNVPADSVVALICREFNVNEEWLRDGTGEMFAPDASDELEALVKKYDLSNADQVLIEKYVNLKAGSRETIINFISDVAAAIGSLDAPNAKAFPSGGISSDIDIDAEVEAYRQQLELQKKAGAGLSLSNGGEIEKIKEDG